MLARRLLHLFVALGFLGIAIAGVVVFLRADEGFRLTDFPDILLGTTVPLVLAAFVLGASSIGAEWRAGTMTTLLTWEPRRIRVLVAKAIVVAVIAIALTVVIQAVLAGALLAAAVFQGSSEGADADWFRDLAGVVLRGSALAGVAALIGFSLGSLGRNTALALGVAFIYLAILEGGLLGGVFPGIRRWLLVGNTVVLVGGQPDPEIVGRSVLGAGILLSLYAIAAVAVAAAVFRARDVT